MPDTECNLNVEGMWTFMRSFNTHINHPVVFELHNAILYSTKILGYSPTQCGRLPFQRDNKYLHNQPTQEKCRNFKVVIFMYLAVFLLVVIHSLILSFHYNSHIVGWRYLFSMYHMTPTLLTPKSYRNSM